MLLEWGADVEGKCVGQETQARDSVELDNVWQVDLVRLWTTGGVISAGPKARRFPSDRSAGASTPRPGREWGDRFQRQMTRVFRKFA